MSTFAILSALIGVVGGALSGVFYGYAAIQKAKAWRIWAERCDPKGTFHPPTSSVGDKPERKAVI
jgi:hypothetical protein